jgi:hypothetical protein
MDDFRDPAVFLATRHPLLFLEWGFFQVLFLEACGFDAVAAETVAPEKTIRPVMSALMAISDFLIIIRSREIISCGSLPRPKSHKIAFFLLTFL